MLVLTYGLESWPHHLVLQSKEDIIQVIPQQGRGLAHPDKWFDVHSLAKARPKQPCGGTRESHSSLDNQSTQPCPPLFPALVNSRHHNTTLAHTGDVSSNPLRYLILGERPLESMSPCHSVVGRP